MERTEIIKNPHQHVTKGKGLTVANFLVTFRPDSIATREDLTGKGPGYVFADGGIAIEQTDAQDLGTFIQQCIEINCDCAPNGGKKQREKWGRMRIVKAGITP